MNNCSIHIAFVSRLGTTCMYIKGIHSRVSINILHWHLHRCFVNTWSTSWLTFGLESTYFCRHAIECQSIHMTQSTLSQLSTDCPLSVTCVLTKTLIDYWLSVGYRSRCRSRVHRGVDQVLIEGWSRVSIDMTTDVLSTHDTSIGL